MKQNTTICFPFVEYIVLPGVSDEYNKNCTHFPSRKAHTWELPGAAWRLDMYKQFCRSRSCAVYLNNVLRYVYKLIHQSLPINLSQNSTLVVIPATWKLQQHDNICNYKRGNNTTKIMYDELHNFYSSVYVIWAIKTGWDGMDM